MGGSSASGTGGRLASMSAPSGSRLSQVLDVVRNFLRPRDVFDVPDDLDVMTSIAPGVKKAPKEFETDFGTCYATSYRHAIEGGEDLMVGVAFFKSDVDRLLSFDPDQFWSTSAGTVHAWNVDSRGRVADHSMGSKNAAEIYIGVRVPRSVLESYSGSSIPERSVPLSDLALATAHPFYYPRGSTAEEQMSLYRAWEAKSR